MVVRWSPGPERGPAPAVSARFAPDCRGAQRLPIQRWLVSGSRTVEERLHPVLYFELHLFENLFFILLFRGGKVECA